MRALVLHFINQHTEFEVPSFINSKDIIGAKFLKTGPLTTPAREYSVIESQAVDIFYLHTKFGDCRFSHSRYDFSVEIEKLVS